MSQRTTYFAIPFANVPKDPSYTVWFATWSTERPTVEPGMQAPFVVGATTGMLPAGAAPLGSAVKDPIQPPGPPPPPATSMTDYQRSVSLWLELGREA